MPWEYKTERKQREEFVLEARESKNFSALCRDFGISRKTGYKWRRRASCRLAAYRHRPAAH